MDERFASRRPAHDDLVTEHGAGLRDADLLEVGAAETAGEHLERRLRRRHVRDPRLPELVEDDRQHGAYRRAVAVTLHRCRNRLKLGPCWKVEKALQEMGVPYELAVGPTRPGKRAVVIEHTGQNLYPAIEFENGTWYREESKYMEATIRAGKLMELGG
jgi:hypothetical protein